jgi:hypothetical protein
MPEATLIEVVILVKKIYRFIITSPQMFISLRILFSYYKLGLIKREKEEELN